MSDYPKPVLIDYKAAFFMLARKVSLVNVTCQYAHHDLALKQVRDAVKLIEAVEHMASPLQLPEDN